MSHTPGEWRVRTHANGLRLKNDETGSTVSYVLPAEGASWPEDTICEVWGTEHDDEANARLIAAAPELLAALKWALTQIPRYSQRIKGQNERYCDGYDAAVAAIGKAESIEGTEK